MPEFVLEVKVQGSSSPEVSQARTDAREEAARRGYRRLGITTEGGRQVEREQICRAIRHAIQYMRRDSQAPSPKGAFFEVGSTHRGRSACKTVPQEKEGHVFS